MIRSLSASVVFLIVTLPISAQDIPLSKILVEKEGWRALPKGWPKITFLDAEPSGKIDIYQLEKTAHLTEDSKIEKLSLPKFMSARKDQISVKTRAGAAYNITVHRFLQIDRPEKDKKVVSTIVAKKNELLNLPGLVAPSCLTVWPDEGHLVIGEATGAYLWAVRIEEDGALGPGDRYYSLRTDDSKTMRVSAMTMDAGFLLYACTPIGIQVFDPTGRLSGVIASPAKEEMTAITIGGTTADTLFIAAGDRIFARKIQGKAPYTLKKGK